MLALLALPLLAVSARGQVGEEEEKHFKPDNTSSFLVTRWRIGACWRTSLRTWRGSTSIPTTSTGDHPRTAPGTFGQREEKRFDTSWRQQLLAVSKRVLSEQSNPLLLQKVFSVTQYPMESIHRNVKAYCSAMSLVFCVTRRYRSDV